VPILLWPVPLPLLPVLVADYLALHFAGLGLLVLAIAGPAVWPRLTVGSVLVGLVLGALCLATFGLATDRYATAFVPGQGRLVILAALVPGVMLFTLGDAVLTEGGRSNWARLWVVRGAALLSLGLAVALRPGELFFLLMILPIILAYFLIFGLIGGWVGRATWRPIIPGLALGLVLGWALAATFPLFAA
jgi:hypothetical protein